MNTIVFNQTTTHVITNCNFDCLSPAVLISLYQDGRVFSHFIERWLPSIYSGLTHIPGCEKYDHVDSANSNIKYDQKTFTKRGCNFMPSNMIGEGRKFDPVIFKEKTANLNYIIVSNVNFPEIKIRFVTGVELADKYPNGKIPFTKFNEFFDEIVSPPQERNKKNVISIENVITPSESGSELH